MHFKFENHKLLLIYLVLVVILIFRISVHPKHYTTPDSIAYLEKAKQIKYDFAWNVKGKFTVWPVGYPLLIATVSFLTKTSVLVASKVINFLCIAVIFILFNRKFGEKSWVFALPFFSYNFLEIASQTWSELPFMTIVLLFLFVISNHETYQTKSYVLGITLTILAVSSFLLRYLGGIYINFLLIFALKHIYNRKKELSKTFFISYFLSLAFSFWYFYDNLLVSGFLTGDKRVVFGHQTVIEFLTGLIQGLSNEFFFARNYFFNGNFPDFLFFLSVFFQLALIGVLIKNKKYLKFPIVVNEEVKFFGFTGVLYLVIIIFLRIIIPFDTFDYRMLFPFSFPVIIGVLSLYIHENQSKYFEKTHRYLFYFTLFSWLINLPKQYILAFF